ncbi:MAG: FadR family transcriptional regulator [Proteobacteria bacterium]|nr:FadR family transcriptional regulator [Pseudomonadota bacterium]
MALPRNGSAHLAVAEAIGSRIVRGDFPSGSVLPNEARWASDFKVSRSVVREAIKMLAAKSLLTSRPKVGSRVEPRENWNLLDHDVLGWYTAGPDRASILKTIQQFRHIIEPEAAALAAEHRTEAQMELISAACQQMATAPNVAERAGADVRFHLEILKASANELLLPLGVLIDSALRNLFVLITVEAGDLRYAQDLHNNIEKAIRQRKPQAARLAVRRLLENSDHRIAVWSRKGARR